MHDAVVDELAANVDVIVAVVERLPRDALHEPPSADEWAIAEIIGHIRAADAIWTPRIMFALVHDGVTMPDVDERALQHVLDAADLDIGDQATSLLFARTELVGVVRALTEPEWSHTCRHGDRGEMAVIDLVMGLAGHEREHLAQLRAMADGLGESFTPGAGR